MKTFSLEQPITLQLLEIDVTPTWTHTHATSLLACIGSRSTINYGTNTTIKFGRETYVKYFDMANVEYYDVILGTPFLRRFGITLDFSSPGTIRKGNEVIPTGKVSFDDNGLTNEDKGPWVSRITQGPKPSLAH
ncbi:hypothetical protein JB92DRAFT_3069348 [Gautieria morchelliformis]|nr:hypothetical protein JB92DRAFT_3069348 [Gautieria morchelliformis]